MHGMNARDKSIERYRNESVSEPKILPSCMQSGFQNVSKYGTSDHELRSSLSVNTKCECDERVLKVKNVRSITETETYNHAKVCTIATKNNVDRRNNQHFDLRGKENLEEAILKIQQLARVPCESKTSMYRDPYYDNVSVSCNYLF